MTHHLEPLTRFAPVPHSAITLISRALLKRGISLWHGALTVMNDSIFQQRLSQVDPLLWFAYLSNLCEPRYKLTAEGSTTLCKGSSVYKQTHGPASHRPTTGDLLLEARAKTVSSDDTSSEWPDFLQFWRKCSQKTQISCP